MISRLISSTLFATLFITSLAFGQGQPDPSGTWKWTVTFNNNTREQTLNLKLANGVLTGSILGRNGEERPIQEATYKGGVVDFKVVRERNGEKFVSHYTGKVSGETITGNSEMNFGGQTNTREWVATRSK